MPGIEACRHQSQSWWGLTVTAYSHAIAPTFQPKNEHKLVILVKPFFFLTASFIALFFLRSFRCPYNLAVMGSTEANEHQFLHITACGDKSTSSL